MLTITNLIILNALHMFASNSTRSVVQQNISNTNCSWLVNVSVMYTRKGLCLS